MKIYIYAKQLNILRIYYSLPQATFVLKIIIISSVARCKGHNSPTNVADYMHE